MFVHLFVRCTFVGTFVCKFVCILRSKFSPYTFIKPYITQISMWHTTSKDKKEIAQPLGTKKKSRNLSGQKKIMQPLGRNLSGPKNQTTSGNKIYHATSRDKKITQALRTKENYANSWDKKITKLLGTKIMPPLRTNKSGNLSRQKISNSWDKNSHATSWVQKSCNQKIPQPLGTNKKSRILLGQKKSHNLLGQQQKSRNLSGQKNHANYRK